MSLFLLLLLLLLLLRSGVPADKSSLSFEHAIRSSKSKRVFPNNVEYVLRMVPDGDANLGFDNPVLDYISKLDSDIVVRGDWPI